VATAVRDSAGFDGDNFLSASTVARSKERDCWKSRLFDKFPRNDRWTVAEREKALRDYTVSPRRTDAPPRAGG